eukprot:1448042-Rhodomonas_salina.1
MSAACRRSHCLHVTAPKSNWGPISMPSALAHAGGREPRDRGQGHEDQGSMHSAVTCRGRAGAHGGPPFPETRFGEGAEIG